MEILGIDIGGSGIKGALVNIKEGKLTSERHRIATPKPATPTSVAATVAEMVKHFEWKGAFGCAFPARIRRGVALTASNIDRSWIGTDVEKLLADKTGLTARVLNDADAAGVAEMAFGAGRNREDVVLLLTFGTGIGSALFVNDVLIPNTEFGHIVVNGMVGEHFASDRIREEEKLGWKRWAQRVQKYLDRVEFLMSPDLIIIGGGVSKPKRWAKFSDSLVSQAELVPAELENLAGIIGAAYSARPITKGPDVDAA